MIDYSILNKILIKKFWDLDKSDAVFYECYYYFNNENKFKRIFITLDTFNVTKQYFITKYLSWENNNYIFYNNDYTKNFTFNVDMAILNSNFEITFCMQPFYHDIKINKNLLAFSEKDIERILKIKLIESIID